MGLRIPGDPGCSQGCSQNRPPCSKSGDHAQVQDVDADLERLANLWQKLPLAVREAILTLAMSIRVSE